MKYWTFYDYVTGTNRNAITDWISSQPAGTRQRLKSALNTTLVLLEGRESLDRPLVGQLRGAKCRGLFELVLRVEKTQFRLIGCYGPRKGDFTLLVGAVEKDRRLIPPDVCATANVRKEEIAQRSHVCVHRFD